jgi:tetratricopeptide (TPR) repeat protein
MLPPPPMPATKNRVEKIVRRAVRAVTLFAAAVFVGCAPGGPRALLDGERLLREGDHGRAIAKLERACRRLPQEARAWNYLGLAYHRAGRLEEAQDAYGRAVVLRPEDGAVRFNLGCLYVERDENERAIRELSIYLNADSSSEVAWVKLGTAQFRVGQLEAAERSFREALQINGRLVEAWNGFGMVQLQRRRVPEAYQSFKTAAELQPDYVPALVNAAVVADDHLKNRDMALERYRALLALPSGMNAAAVEKRVRQLELELRREAEARAAAVEAAKAAKPVVSPTTTQEEKRPGTAPRSREPVVRQPEDEPPKETPLRPMVEWVVPAQPAVQLPGPVRRMEMPETAAPRVVDKEKEGRELALNRRRAAVEAEATRGRGATYPRYGYSAEVLRRGDQAAAERLVEQGVRFHDGNRLEEAIELYQKATENDPGNFDAYYNLGVAAYERGDWEMAQRAYERALVVEPESLKARFNFAAALERGGYPVDAVIELERLLERHDGESRIHYRLGSLYATVLRHMEKAREHYRRVLELEPRHTEALTIRLWLERNG